MGMNLTQKILKAHLVEGEMVTGKEIAIRIDQTLTQDATGTMSYLQFEAMGVPRVKTEVSVSYVDHNTLQTGFENADDHRFLQTVAAKHGVHFSRPGNGICHQVHLERFAAPGKTLLGSDSHTPTGGGMAMLAMGAGGLDVAVAMGGGAFYLACPKVVGIKLTGSLQPWTTAKDIILEVLRIMTVKGGVGKVVEYYGEGVKSLTVPERGTITNMGAELGATCSVFPSDDQTLAYLKAQGRENVFVALAADADAIYDEHIEIDLNALTPRIAKPHMPDNVVAVTEVEGTPVQQVLVGSCTNSNFMELTRIAKMLKGKTVHKDVSFAVAPGSKQVFTMLADSGALADLINAGARILESACGPCIGMGQSPSTGAVTVRSFNRNFEGRSGTRDGQVYLASPETCVAAAISGKITDPRHLGLAWVDVPMPSVYKVDDNMIVSPLEPAAAKDAVVVRGPNIAALPMVGALPEAVKGSATLKVVDNITTDHIMPAGGKVLPLRSNIPKISQYVYEMVDPTFPQRALELKAKGTWSIIVGGENYGQGSSREHAALAPMYLGVKAKIVKSFARIHRANLVNFGILPLTFANPADYDKIEQGDALEILDAAKALQTGEELLTVKNVTKNFAFQVKAGLTRRQADIILAGGMLNYTRSQATGD
ncbi:MAG TPA: aconitate hydratase [Symbiobacteriaceae bacterium]|jgi:aconitate hydratase